MFSSSSNPVVFPPLLATHVSVQLLTEATTSTKARIGKTWTSKNVTARMVDFCIFLDPHDSIGDMVGWSKEDEEEEEGISTDARDPAASNAIDAVLRAWGAVNHTDHEALRRLPVAVSIETKLAENAFTKAELQTGVWHTAHLRMLRGSAAVPRVAANAVAAAMDDAADSGQAKPTYDLGREDWLPGLIIQGHEWTFVATVRAGLRGHGARPVSRPISLLLSARCTSIWPVWLTTASVRHSTPGPAQLHPDRKHTNPPRHLLDPGRR